MKNSVIQDQNLIDEYQIIDDNLKRALEAKAEFLRKTDIAMATQFMDTADVVKRNIIIGRKPDGTWLRLSITDNAFALSGDGGFWKTVRVEPYSAKLEELKNPPKELKEVQK